MTETIFTILGGIGLFLFGMKVMTEALRAAAGAGLRRFLTRFTTTPLTGVATGAVVTALVQSSSATTVMTVGFVGAGLLSFPHALGVLYGANIGTTATGWMIAFLGFKMQLGTVALPALFAASLTLLLAQGRLARAARAIAGLCLIFIGLTMMQAGAAGFGDAITPDRLPSGAVFSLVQLMLLGLVLTVVMQSSSAAIAIALVFLGSGAVLLDQAAAMVIGMNLGTTVTALLAAIGGASTMRQTAVANLLFKICTAIIAFPLLGLSGLLLSPAAARFGDQIALVLFHSTFNIVGALIFLPVTAQFAGFVQWLIPDRHARLTETLEPALLSDEGAAMDAVQSALSAIATRLFGTLGAVLQPGDAGQTLTHLRTAIDPALEDTESYLAQIRIPDGKNTESARLSALLHQIDHLRRMLRRAEQTERIPFLWKDHAMRRPARFLGAALQQAARAGTPAQAARRLQRLSRRVETLRPRYRRATLLSEHVGLITAGELFQRTDALRWLERTVHHAERIAHYAGVTAHSTPDTPTPVHRTT